MSETQINEGDSSHNWGRKIGKKIGDWLNGSYRCLLKLVNTFWFSSGVSFGGVASLLLLVILAVLLVVFVLLLLGALNVFFVAASVLVLGILSGIFCTAVVMFTLPAIIVWMLFPGVNYGILVLLIVLWVAAFLLSLLQLNPIDRY